MSEGLINKLDMLPMDERDRINDIVGLNMWVREVETVDHVWKMDLQNQAKVMNEIINHRIREQERNTSHQTDLRYPESSTRNDSRNENRDENCYHPYRARTDRDRNDHDRDQDCSYKYRDNDRDRNDHDRGYTRGRNNDRDRGQDRGYARTCDNGYNRNQDSEQRTFNNRTNDRSDDNHKKCPALTQHERDLLNEHEGCNKCRKFYIGHHGRDCDNWPDADMYQPLTLQDALDAKSRRSKSLGSNNHNMVTAMMPHSEFNDVYNASVHALLGSNPSYDAPTGMYDNHKADRTMSAPPTSHIREINAILPSSSIPFNLGNGSDTSDENAFNHEVSKAPLTVEHLTWDANVFGGNEFPSKINCLLDNGAHLVLIRPEAIADLALPIRKLETPISVTLALEGQETVSVLHDYVFLQLSSSNNEWTSKTVRALVAPGLCSNILLGLPFLSHNNIVIDHEARTAIDKVSGFDLLSNNSRMPRDTVQKMLPPKVKVKRILKNRRAAIDELKTKFAERLKSQGDGDEPYTAKPMNAVSAIKATIERLASKDKLIKLEEKIKDEYKEIFKPIPHISLLPKHDMARIRVKEAYTKISNRSYTCPRQYREAFKTLIDQRLESGFIRPSSSPYASPSFIIPKADKTVLPWWVCDFRELNANTIPNNWTMPQVDEVLTDCARGKIWATIDMTDSFFQTMMHPNDIHRTAVSTPFGTYEWCVMPMGLRNSPAIHQRRVTSVLHPFIGKICHIYLDDIVIWSDTIEEHIENVKTIMNVLREARLHVNCKKTKLFCEEIDFLGHHISQRGVEADNRKVAKILDWPVPKCVKDVRQFLGLVRYLNAFLLKLAMQSDILNRLTWKDCNEKFPEWTQKYQDAFEAIKQIVVSRECLTIIDHTKMPEMKIFVTTDASERATGAVLSFGTTWETARPVAFESMTLKGAELHYPVHEKELLAILRALRKWKVDLLGSEFLVYTDHKTLLNFNTQRDLSRRQACWMEELAIYDCKFVYVKGEDNTVADSLSRFPFPVVTESTEAEKTGHHPYEIGKGCIALVSILSKSGSPLDSVASLSENV